MVNIILKNMYKNTLQGEQWVIHFLSHEEKSKQSTIQKESKPHKHQNFVPKNR